MANSPNAKSGDLVAYHSERAVGTLYKGSGQEFSFFSAKSEKLLKKALGRRVWVIASAGKRSPRFFLVGYYVPERLVSSEDVYYLKGKGMHIDPMIEINDHTWFKALYKEQNNFSYGNFSRIRSNAITKGLEETLAAALSIENAELARTIIDDGAENAIRHRGDLAETEKDQLIKARRGQGRFRQDLEALELCCRLTRIADRGHLRASHIKPWCKSDDREKLDPNNGLLLSPHIDHLFDRGYISFTDDGDLMISARLDRSILAGWGLAASVNVGVFTTTQCTYLAYHRQNVFVK